MSTFKHCPICNEEKPEGITIYNTFICLDCEKDMIQTEPSEVKYQYYIEKLKVINQKSHISSY